MNRLRSYIFAVVLASMVTGSCFGVTVGSGASLVNPKLENQLVITWEGRSEDPTANQVRVLDDRWNPVLALKVLKAVPDAQRVSIYDVSGYPNKIIAVAAVYVSKEGKDRIPPVATLLIFDFGGRLLGAYRLPPSREILRLVVDENANIWTLTSHADDRDPATIPMVVEYSPDGRVQKELMTRSRFPFHAASTKLDSRIGSVWMGYEAGTVWFWLPGSTEFVTFATNQSQPVPTIIKTGLPITGNQEPPDAIFRDRPGSIVAEVREFKDNTVRLAYYRWTSSAARWTRFTPGECEGHFLIGVQEGKQVFAGAHGNRSETCEF